MRKRKKMSLSEKLVYWFIFLVNLYVLREWIEAYYEVKILDLELMRELPVMGDYFLKVCGM